MHTTEKREPPRSRRRQHRKSCSTPPSARRASEKGWIAEPVGTRSSTHSTKPHAAPHVGTAPPPPVETCRLTAWDRQLGSTSVRRLHPTRAPATGPARTGCV